MADGDDPQLEEDRELTAEEILRFGPVVEAQVWHTSWVVQERAPIAVAAGRPKLGQVFDEDGVGKAIVIRPCVSRGRRIRGLPPIYTPNMLEKHATVFSGWPQYFDHVPPELAETIAKRGRSVKELGGQVLKSFWQQGFTHEDDAQYGYRPGAVLAEVWANELVRKLVGNNPNVLHTSINAWPTSGKPGTAPWNKGVKGMLIEGIRKQPQGSLDYVPRGGAGGRLLSEGDEGGWPEAGWTDDDRRLVVSLAESVYAPEPVTPPDFSKMKPEQLRAWVQENAEHLLPALVESDAGGNGGNGGAADQTGTLTEADVKRIVADAVKEASSSDSTEQVEERLRESFEETLAERDEQRSFADEAKRLIEAAEGIPAGWKKNLIDRFSMTAEGASPALLVEAYEDDEGKQHSKLEALRKRVGDTLTETRDLIAEAQGKPRVTGEGGRTADAGGDGERSKLAEKDAPDPFAEKALEYGLAESEEGALALVGVEAEEKKDD